MVPDLVESSTPQSTSTPVRSGKQEVPALSFSERTLFIL